MTACYLELYEEDEVKHINSVSQIPQLLVVQKLRVHMAPVNAHP